MVKIPKVSPNLLIAGGLAVAAFFLVREVRNSAKDLANFGENLKFPELPQLPSINISNPFNQTNPIDRTFPNTSEGDKAILEKINEIGGLGKLNQQSILDLVGKLTPLGTPENPANNPNTPSPIDVIINDKTLTQQEKKDLLSILNPSNRETDSNSINDGRFNPPNTFGFGLLGEDKKGISVTLAKELGIFGKSTDEISKTQIKVLKDIDTSESIFDIVNNRAGAIRAESFLSAFTIPFTNSTQQNQQKQSAKIIETQKQNNVMIDKIIQTQPKVISNIGNFKGGGESFIGGSVNETPIERLSLSQIIDKFGVSASKARDLQFQARNEGAGFDFGTNTGNAIQQSQQILSSIQSKNVSNPALIGLTSTQIAEKLINGFA
jgi:hypothetical protein